jgi:hypothetical protein
MDRIDAWLVANDPENPFVFDILAENENICLLADGATLPPNSSTDETGTPDPEATSEITPTP